MAIDAIIGRVYTFQALFVDDLNVPVNVASPVITIFHFENDGTKTVDINNQPMLLVQPSETGRYTYQYLVPTTYYDGQPFYAEMRATDPNFEGVLLVDQELNALTQARINTFMTSRFVKGG